MGVCGCVIPNPNCHCHFTPVSDWQYNNSTNHLVTMPKDVLDQIGKEHTDEIERLRQQVEDLHDLMQRQIFVNSYLRQQNAELVEVLREGIRSLTDDQPAIVDVVWCATQPCETLHDYFVAAIAKATGGK